MTEMASQNPNLSGIALIRGQPTSIQILILGTLINNFGNLIGPFMVVLLIQKLHFETTFVGRIVSMFGLLVVASISVGGYLTDRIGRRKTLLLSLFGGGCAALLLGFSEGRGSFLVLLAAFALLTELFRPASLALFADLVPEESRLQVLATVRVAVNVGLTLSMVVGGILVDLNWKWLFWIDGTTTVLYGIIVFVSIAEPVHRAKASPAYVPSARTSPWTNFSFLVFLVGSLFYGIVYATHLTVLPLIVTQHAKLSSSFLGLLLGYSCALCIVAEVWVTKRTGGYPTLWIIALGSSLVALGLSLSGYFLNEAWLFLMVTVWSLGEMLTVSRLMQFAANYAPSEYRGKFLGAWQSTIRFATVLSPIIFLSLYQGNNLMRVSWAIGGTGVIAVLSFSLLGMHCRRTAG